MKVTHVAKFAAIVSALAFVMTAAPAMAQTKDEAKCRSTIAKGFGKYTATAMKTIAGCHKSRNGGKGDVDCNDLDVADSPKGKAAGAATKFIDSLAKCAAGSETAVLAEFGPCPSPHGDLDDTGAADDIDSLAELGACLVAHGETWSERASLATLGRPVVADLTKISMKCHGTIAKTVGKLMATIAKDRSKCQATADKGNVDGPIGSHVACSTSDGQGKIAGALQKLDDGIAKACVGTSEEMKAMDSCASTVGGLQDCAGDDVAMLIGGGLSASAFEFPDACQIAGVQVQVNPGFGSELNTDSRLDTGFSGAGHGSDLTEGFVSRVKLENCTADCSSCDVRINSNKTEPFGNCRCDGALATKCEADSGIPGTASADCGGGACNCFFGAPLPLSAVGVSTCVVTKINDELDGVADIGNGSGTTTVSSSALVFNGISQFAPCPTCDGDGAANDGVRGGMCIGGANNGDPCDVNGTSALFGDLSYECQPENGSNIAGDGLALNLELTNEGSSSITPVEDCGGTETGNNCYCRECLDDPRVGCNQDSDCSDAGLSAICGIDAQCSGACVTAGDCTALGLGSSICLGGQCRPAVGLPCDTDGDCPGTSTCTGPTTEPQAAPDSCATGCTADGSGTGTGTCDGETNSFCDGFVQDVNNGNGSRGVLPCVSDLDCDGFSQDACGGDCGVCTQVEDKSCFTGAISADGSTGTYRSELVSTFCAAHTDNPAVNDAVGAPSPGRLKLDFTFNARCADGSPAQIPGAVNCNP